MVLRIKDRQSRILFMNENLVDLFLYLPKGPLVEGCQYSGVAYSHALKMVTYWGSMGLIISNKSGQQYNFFYTASGNKLAVELVRCKGFLKKSGIQWSLEE